MSSPAGIDHPITEPLPVLTRRPSLRDTFSSLRLLNFRLYFAGLAAASGAGWLARLSSDWLMIEETGDVALVALVVVSQLVPSIVLGPWAGVVSDRLSARATVIVSHVIVIASFLGIGIPAVLGVASVPLIIIGSLVLGIGTAFDLPARAVLLVQVVGTRSLPNAMSLNAAVQQFAGIAGALLTAVLLAVIGPGWVLIAASIGPLAGIVLISSMRRAALHPATKIPVRRGQVREALRYVRRKPEIRVALLLISTLSFFALTASVLMAWAAQEKFGLGPVGYSLFQTAGALGAMLGCLLSARRRQLRLRDSALLLAASGAVWACTGFAPAPLIFVAGVIITLLLRSMFLIGNDSFTQLSTNGAIRGRVVSLYVLCLTGSQALGALAAGWSLHALGGELTFLIAGGAPTVIALAVVLTLTLRARRATLRSSTPRSAVRAPA